MVAIPSEDLRDHPRRGRPHRSHGRVDHGFVPRRGLRLGPPKRSRGGRPRKIGGNAPPRDKRRTASRASTGSAARRGGTVTSSWSSGARSNRRVHRRDQRPTNLTAESLQIPRASGESWAHRELPIFSWCVHRPGRIPGSSACPYAEMDAAKVLADDSEPSSSTPEKKLMAAARKVNPWTPVP